MDMALKPELLLLRDELESQLKTLKNNRERVPLEVLKTKYKKRRRQGINIAYLRCCACTGSSYGAFNSSGK